VASSRDGEEHEPQEWYDEEKREVALVYRDALDAVREDEAYERLKAAHRARYGEE